MTMLQRLRRRRAENGQTSVGKGPVTPTTLLDPIPIPSGDPLETVLLSAGGPVGVGDLELVSPTLETIRSAGVELIVPLIGQGELLGALYLGPRLSDQPYSSDDRRLLGGLAAQVAPAMRVAQLIREQQAEAKERERIEQELKVAALIQQTLLPKELPAIPGWHVSAFYRPARAVGGDFYDFIPLGDGRLGVVIGDVTDKGVPAALVMATCRSMLRAAAQRHGSPSQVLAEVNDALVPEIPAAMFVTCLYAIIDTERGDVVLANAGHNLPYMQTSDGVVELRAAGMPLGLMPGMDYEEKRYTMGSGEIMVLTSDGITEAHDPRGEMYGFGRLMSRVARRSDDMVTAVVSDLEAFTGPDAEQEDDITLVVVRRSSSAQDSALAFESGELLDAFTVASEEGNERVAIARLAEVVAPLGFEERDVERLKTALAETVMNAIEHGNENRPELEVGVEVRATDEVLTIRVTDQGGAKEIPEAQTPDLEAKLAGTQTPRGWGLFLIEKMVDEVRSTSDGRTHTVELIVKRKGAL